MCRGQFQLYFCSLEKIQMKKKTAENKRFVYKYLNLWHWNSIYQRSIRYDNVIINPIIVLFELDEIVTTEKLVLHTNYKQHACLCVSVYMSLNEFKCPTYCLLTICTHNCVCDGIPVVFNGPYLFQQTFYKRALMTWYRAHSEMSLCFLFVCFLLFCVCVIIRWL